MAFDHAYGDGLRARLPAKDTYQRAAAPGGDVDTGKIVEALGRPLVDRQALCAIGLDDVAEGREGFLR